MHVAGDKGSLRVPAFNRVDQGDALVGDQLVRGIREHWCCRCCAHQIHY